MKRYFFLGFGVGFIIAGLIATVYIEVEEKKEKSVIETKIEAPYSLEIIPEKESAFNVETEKSIVESKTPVVTKKEEVVQPNKVEEKKEVKPVLKIEGNEEQKSKQKKENLEIIKKTAKEEKKPVKKEIEVEKKIEKIEIQKNVEKIKEKSTAPLSPTGEEIIVSKPPVVIEEPEEKKVESVRETKNGEYYVQVITTSSVDECERVIKKIKDVKLSYTKKGSKYTVISENTTEEDGKQILEKLEKYNLKGLLVKKSRK